MNLSDDALAAVTVLLSTERLRKFLALAGSPRAAVALHQKTLRIAGRLMCVTAIVEIALRNTVCDKLASHFGRDDWLRNPPVPFKWREQEKSRIGEAVASARRAAYLKLGVEQKHAIDARLFRSGVPTTLGHNELVRIRQQSMSVSNGQIVAQLTLFFWRRLFSTEYDSGLWRPVLKRVFPDKALRRADVAAQIECIYQTRNRIAHHEPVYGQRLLDALKAIEFVVTRLAQQESSQVTPLAQLLSDDREALSRQADDFRWHVDALSASILEPLATGS